jgi:hypothetical protein
MMKSRYRCDCRLRLRGQSERLAIGDTTNSEHGYAEDIG